MLNGHGAAIERAVIDTPALHALQREAKLRKLGLFFFVLLQLKFKARLLFLHIERIIAGIKLCLAVVQFENAGHNAVKKIPVMGDRQDGPLKFFNIALKPFDRVHVQMVRRLVKQQNIGLFQQQPR